MNGKNQSEFSVERRKSVIHSGVLIALLVLPYIAVPIFCAVRDGEAWHTGLFLSFLAALLIILGTVTILIALIVLSAVAQFLLKAVYRFILDYSALDNVSSLKFDNRAYEVFTAMGFIASYCCGLYYLFLMLTPGFR